MKSPENKTSLYSPSWIDRFTNWIENLPGSSWGYYAGIGLILVVIQIVPTWGEGALSMGTFHPVPIFLVAGTSLIIAIIPYFDTRALTALEIIKPALTIDEDKFQQLAFQLSNLPAFKAILASLLTLIVVFITEFIGGAVYQIEEFAGYPLSLILSRGIYLVCWWFFGVFIYHTIHQLGLINQIYTRYTQISLFKMKPLYGFSNLTALTAGSTIILPYGFLLINPTVKLNDPVVLSIYLTITTIALATFLLPQLGIHQLQNQEKDHLLEEAFCHYEAIIAKLHQYVDENSFGEMGNLNLALNNMEKEINSIKKTSTWPWQPETIRWLFTALVLPLLMWLAQHFLGLLLNP